MKKIGLLSDTHSEVDEKIFHHFKDVDEIWHAGDVGDISVIHKLQNFKPLRGVYGNIDTQEIRNELPLFNVFDCEGMKVLIMHIAGRPNKYAKNAYHLIKTHQPQLFICGHSHILLVQKDTHLNLLWLNPGACGNKGFHKIKTLLRFEIDKGMIQNLEAIEIGYRNAVSL